jgi:hypothetical protein
MGGEERGEKGAIHVPSKIFVKSVGKTNAVKHNLMDPPDFFITTPSTSFKIIFKNINLSFNFFAALTFASALQII